MGAIPAARNDAEVALRGYLLLRHFIVENPPEQYMSKLAAGLRVDYRAQAERGPAIVSAYVRPLFDLLEEQSEDRSAVLDLLAKYRRRSEWVQRAELRKKFENGKEASKQDAYLKEDLYAYLFDQGLPFVSEPRSPEGNVDVFWRLY